MVSCKDGYTESYVVSYVICLIIVNIIRAGGCVVLCLIIGVCMLNICG